MKIAELNKLTLGGQSLVTGRLTSYKAEQTEKAGSNEKFGILIGDQVHHFTVWAPKGTALAAIKRPEFVDRPGAVVVVVGPSIKQDGKYLRTGADSVQAIEG